MSYCIDKIVLNVYVEESSLYIGGIAMLDLEVSVSHDVVELGKAYERLKFQLPQDTDLFVSWKEIKEERVVVLPLYVVIPQAEVTEEKEGEVKNVLNVNSFKNKTSVTVFSVPYKGTKRSIELQVRIMHPEEIRDWYYPYAESILPRSEWKMFHSQWKCFSGLTEGDKEYFYSNLISAVKQRGIT